MKGNELAAVVKSKWPDCAIILTAANLQDFHQEDHPIAGVNCLLNKPFTMSQLREAIGWALDPYVENQQNDPIFWGEHVGQLEKLKKRKNQ